MLINMYKEGGVASFGELMDRVAVEAAKGAVVGAATLGTGAAGKIGAKAIAGTAFVKGGGFAAKALGRASKGLPFGAEVLGLTGASSLVDGHIPTAQDFADNALMLFTLKGFHKTSDRAINEINKRTINKLYDIFIKEGKSPKAAVQEAMHDPVKLQNLLAEEKEEIRKGYEDVKQNPLKGTREGKDDVLVTMQDGIKRYIINRGAAIKDPQTGDIIVQGKALEKETGTNGNFGFSKMIFKHGISVEEAQLLPEIIRYYQPLESYENRGMYRVPLDKKHNLIAVFGVTNDGKNKEITMHKERISGNKVYKMSPKKDTSTPQALVVIPPTDTKQGGGNPRTTNLDSEVSNNSIAENAGPVNDFNGPTKIEIPRNKPVQTEIKGEDIVKRSKIIADLQKAGLSEEEAWTVAEQSAGEILSQDFIEDLAGPLIKENSPMTYPDFDKNKVGENLISAIEQQKDAAAQLADISEAYEEKLKASGVQEQEAQGAARIFANIIDNIAKRNKVSPKTAQGLLDFKMTREEQPLPAADTKEAYAQAAAMYRNPAGSLGEYSEFYKQNKENPREQNKSFYRWTTSQGVEIDVPFSRVKHIDKKHHLTTQQWQAVEQGIEQTEYIYTIPGQRGENNGQQFFLKINTPQGKAGIVLEVLPNGRVLLDTAFFDSDANIDNWAKNEPLQRPSLKKPVLVGSGNNSLADIVKTVNGKEAYARPIYGKDGREVPVQENPDLKAAVPRKIEDISIQSINTAQSKHAVLNKMFAGKKSLTLNNGGEKFILSHSSAKKMLHTLMQAMREKMEKANIKRADRGNAYSLAKELTALAPQIFQEAQLVYTHADLKGTEGRTIKRYGAAFAYKGKNYLAMFVVKQDRLADMQIYDYQVQEDEKRTGFRQLSAIADSQYAPSIVSIEELRAFVNGKLDKYRKNKGSEIPGREQTDTFNQPQERDLFSPDKEAAGQVKKDIKDYQSGTLPIWKEIDLGKPSIALQSAGVPNQILKIKQKTIKKDTQTKHQVKISTFENLPELLADPVMILKSDTVPGSFVAVLKDDDMNDNRVVAAIDPDGTVQVNYVDSVYGKGNKYWFKTQIEKGNLLYIDEKEALKESSRLYLRGVPYKAYKESILTKEDIVKKYRQGNRGSIELFKEGGVYTALVKIMQTGDKSTLMHELGHLWLYTAQDIYGFEEFEAVKKDLDAWLGKPSVVDGRFVYGRDQQEKFAQGLETYLMEGRAPAPTLQRIFEKFREWFLAIYNGALVEMSDAGRAVYDRLFTLAGADVKEHLTLYQDEVKNKKVRQAVKQLREEGRADVEGLNLQDVEDYLKILEMGAPPLPKDTLLAYLKKYGANYASAGKVDAEAYKNAKVPNKPQGIGDDLARRLIDWGFLHGDINTYEDLDALNEEAADMIQRALNGERVYRTEDAAAAEEFEAYKEAVAMAEDALGGRISEYKRVLKIIKGLRLEGYRPVSGKDIDFLLKQVENLEEAVSREERKAADKKLGRAQSENENLKERLEAQTAAAARAQKEARAAKAQAEELKEKVLNPEDITEIHHSETGEAIELIFNDDLKPLETVELKKGAFPHEKDNGKNTKILLCDAVLGNNNKITLKNYGSDFILNKTSVGKMLSTAHRNATALFKKGKISEQQKNESIAAAKDFIAQIGSIFPQAQLIVSHKDAKHNTKKTIKRYAAKATYDGKDFYLMIVVKNNGTLQDFVIYDLQAEEKSRGGCISDAVSAGQYPTANNSIEDIKNFVKRRIAKYNKYFNKTYGQAGNRVYTLELQGKNKIAQTPQTQSKELSLEKHAEQIKKAVVEELEKREVENKRQMLKELKDAKTPQDILEACENLLDKLEKAYENTPQGKMEKSKLEPPKTDWDRVKTGLLKTVTDILLEQNQKLDAAKDLLKEASRAKLGYRGPLSENEKAALAAAKNFLKENYLPRVMAALKNAVKDLHHLSGRQADKMIGFYASTLTNFNGPLQRQINSFLSWARQAQKENYNRYIWRKVNAALDRKIFEKSGASLKAKFTERSMAFLEKAKEFLALKPEQAQREFENRIAAAFEKNTDQEPFEQRLLTGLLEFMTNGRNNDPESSKKLYDDISAFLAAGRKKVLDEAFRKTLNKEFLREAAAQALEQRKIPRGLEWFLNLPDTNLKEFLLNCFGTVEYDELDKDGNIRTVKTNIADALDTLKGQKRTQVDIFYKTDRLNKIFMDVFGLQSAAGVINKIKELSRPCFTAENYMRQKNEAEKQNAAQLIKGGKRVRKDLITEEKLNKLQIMTIWLWYKDTRYDPDAKADYGLRGRLIRQYEEHQLAQMFDLLSPQEIELAEKIQKFTADQYDEENAVFRRLHGFSLPQSENYFPSKARRADQAGETDYMRTYIQNSVNPNFTKKRVKSYRVEMNPLSVLKIAQEHFLRSAEYVNEAETFALLKSVLKSSRINTAFVNVFGQEKAGALYNKMARLIDLQGPQKAAKALKRMDIMAQSAKGDGNTQDEYTKELQKQRAKQYAEMSGNIAEGEAALEPLRESIDKALELNKIARSGGLANARQSFGRFFDSEGQTKAGAEFQGIMQNELVGQLKKIFGGQISEGERAYLDKLYAADLSMAESEREALINNVYQAAQNRVNKDKQAFKNLFGERPEEKEQLNSYAQKYGL